MAGEARQATVGDYVTLVRGTTYKGQLVGEPGPALLGLGSIEPGGGFRTGNYKTYGGDCPDELMLFPGDVYASLKGATKDGKMIGSVARVPPSVPTGRLTQDTVKLVFRTPDPEDATYLYWVLRTPQYRDYCAGHAMGSAVAALSRRDFLSYPVPPPTMGRRRLVALLDSIEEKIELNRRMSETLEAMARALFKSWFVDFAPVRAKAEGRDPGLPKPLADLFPNRLVDSELGEIPEGWEVGRLGDLAGLDKGVSYKGEGLVGQGGLPLVNLGCFAGSGRFKVESIKRYSGEFRQRHVVRTGDLVIANTDMTQKRVILGSPALLPALAGERDCLFSHHAFAVRFQPGAVRWKLYVYFSLLRPEFREIAEGYATGTTVLALPRDGVLNYPLILPSDELLAAFQRQVGQMLVKAELTGRESGTLGDLRDTLQPKLISGEVQVKDAEGFIGRAV